MSGNYNKYKTLRTLRIVIAILMFILVTTSFMFFSHKLSVITRLLHLQFIPSILAASGVGFVTLFVTLLLTLLFGRVYCSWICPLGIWQDMVSRVSRRFRDNRRRTGLSRRFHFKYHKPHPLLRWSVLVIVLVFTFIGFSFPLIALDPYSNWGRIATTLFSPLIQLFSNILSVILPNHISYTPLAEFSAAIFVFSLIFFILVTSMSIFRGRLYCNTVCPVGSLLGVISKVSFLRPAISKSMCVTCGSCASNCKAECIDLESKEIDSSRCVMCFDCMMSCAKGGVRLVPRYKFAVGKGSAYGNEPESHGRRDAIIALGTIGALAAVNVARDNKTLHPEESGEPGGVLPPGAISLKRLQNNCTACHACLASCPSDIISYSTGEYGLNGFFLPVIHYDKGFCSYDCHKCSDICPSEALVPMSIEQKRRTQVGKVHFTAKNCIVFKDKTDCGACDEHCPTKAITMVEWKGRSDGLRYPSVNQDICIGCGACEYICPASPVKAMKVHPLSVHGESEMPKEEKQEEVVVTDFGF